MHREPSHSERWKQLIAANRERREHLSGFFRGRVTENGPADPEHDVIVDLVRASLRNAHERYDAFQIAEYLPQGYHKAQFEDLLAIAIDHWEPKQGGPRAAAMVKALPTDWLQQQLPSAVERYLAQSQTGFVNDLLAICADIDVDFAAKLAARAMASSDGTEREIGEHVAARLRRMPSPNDAPN